LGTLVSGEVLPGAGIRSDTDVDTFVREAVAVDRHPVGGCAMGTGRGAVVDSQLRVRGIDGLRVADASVTPTLPGGSAGASTVMIAEKAADLIRGRTALSPEPV